MGLFLISFKFILSGADKLMLDTYFVANLRNLPLIVLAGIVKT